VGTSTPLGIPTLLDVVGIDNSINGIQAGLTNRSSGVSAYNCLYLNNNLADATVTHFGAFCQNSSNYNDNTFGTGENNKSGVILQNTDGLLSLLSSTSTDAMHVAGINFFTGGSATGNERMRITTGGKIAIGTTTPALGALTIAASTPQLNLSSGIAGKTSWIFRTYPDGSLNIATTTISGLATTTPTALTILKNGRVGLASSTPFYMLSVGNRAGTYGSIVTPENKVATSSSITIDWTKSNQQLVQTGTSATTISFSNVINGATMRVVVCNPGGTAGALTWSGVEWPANTVPTQTTTAKKCDVWSFISTQATSTAASSKKVFGAAVVNYP
jgi:hypothetical protein